MKTSVLGRLFAPSTIRRLLFLGLLAPSCLAPSCADRPAGDVPEAAIDALFARWRGDRTPGFAVGIMRRGRLVFARGYGMADLEHQIPITPRSRFYIASMSKQFTAACAADLARRGVLSLGDPVKKYVPELPDYGFQGREVTIDHLIHHTGGVREWTSLALFAGKDERFEDRIGNHDILRLLLRQTALEFEPGSHYRYSSGGYQLLTEVIERATGKALPALAREIIFDPLGMKDTFFERNYATPVPGRVESYRSLGGGRYERILKHFDAYGDGGVITTIEDLARWDRAFYPGAAIDPMLARKVIERGRLSSGAELPYAFGLEVYSRNGHRVIEHGGGMLGFTVDMARFPDDDLTVVALGNTTEEWSTTMVFRVADLVLAPRPPAPAATARSVRLSGPQLAALPGHYWSADFNFYRRIALRDGRITLDSGEGTAAAELLPQSDREFIFGDDPLRRATFTGTGARPSRLRVSGPGPDDGFEAERYDPTPPSAPGELAPMLGEYRSEELAATYRFWRDGERLLFQINDGQPKVIFPPSEGVIWNSKAMVWIGFGEITFDRDSSGQVSGLSIGDQRVSRIHLRRVR